MAKVTSVKRDGCPTFLLACHFSAAKRSPRFQLSTKMFAIAACLTSSDPCRAAYPMSSMGRTVVKTLLSEQELQAGVAKMAEAISSRYVDRPLTIVAVMTGSLVLLADLIRRLNMPVRVSLIQASSYRGGTESGDLWIRDDMMLDVTDRDVLVVDDIFDTGRTMEAVLQCIGEMKPASLASAVLLHKKERREVQLDPDFVAFHIPDEFVVGYGLDYQDLYRNLPFLAVLEPSDISTQSV